MRKRGQAVFGKGQPVDPAAADGQNQGEHIEGTLVRPLSTASTSELPQPTRQVSNRLSFDPASGVITLPDGEVFYERIAADDSDSDYGEVSGETDSREGASGATSPVADAGEVDANGGTTESGLRAKRHSTYFHHPERRRQQVPGAFPQ